MKRAAVCGLLICGIVAAAPSLAEDSSASDLTEAMQLLARGRLFPAEQAARRAVTAAPESAAAHLTLGRILVRRDQLEAAEPELARAAELDPAIAGIHRKLGFVRAALGRYREARPPLERALQQDPDDAEAWLQLGLCHLELDEPSLAVDAFEQAARDEDYRGVANFNLGVANEILGREGESRAAFEEALDTSLPPELADRANRRIATPVADRDRAAAPRDEEQPWSLGAAAGLAYESTLVRIEVDEVDKGGDGSGVFELDASYARRVSHDVELELGYDFFQSLYFSKTEFDFQSHSLAASASRDFSDVDTAASYSYSLNSLDGSRFLDYHELRWSAGISVTDWWYSTLTPSVRAKRFDDRADRARDANGVAIGFVQLFPIVDWSRFALFGLDLEQEDADGNGGVDAFDYRGVRTQLAAHFAAALGEWEFPVDIRYRFARRNYLHPGGADDGSRRDDRVHSLRGRIELPLTEQVALRTEYLYEDYRSNLSTVDQDGHQIGLMLRARL